jgi:hypothetical protein
MRQAEEELLRMAALGTNLRIDTEGPPSSQLTRIASRLAE